MEDKQLVFDFDPLICDSNQKFNRAWRTLLVSTIKDSMAQVADSINESINAMHASINSMNSRFDTLVKDVTVALSKAEAAQVMAKANSTEITAIRSEMVEFKLECDRKCNDACGEVRELRAECQSLRAENIDLKSQTNNLETYSRRDNLIIYGIPEQNGETASQCEASVRALFVNKLQLTVQEADGIAFVRCHRLYRPRKNITKPIIVRFSSFKDREHIWTKKKMLTDKTVNIGEDFPKSIAYKRRKLFPVFAKAKKLPALANMKVSLKADVLSIGDRKYTVDTLGELQGELSMRNFNERSDNKVVVMGGIFSDFHPLSNFFKVPMVHRSRKYSSVEQAYQHLKSLQFKDQETAAKIMRTTDPGEAKRLSFGIKNFVQDQWDGNREDIMLQLIRAKFSQNTVLADELLATGNKKIGESGKHPYFAVGLSITSKDILKQNLWTGQSKLGSILMTVRDELKSKP